MLLGVDIGGTKCSVVLSDLKGNIVNKISFDTSSLCETMDRIICTVRKISDETRILSCGISCGGPLNEKEGLIMSPPNLPGWDNIRITRIIEDVIGAPCALKNDANACAIAEYIFAQGSDNMIFLTFGTGMGAGIIMNGNLITGVSGLAGEIGHIRLAKEGPVGYGKAGSFESFCSGAGIKKIGRIVACEYTEKGEMPSWADRCDIAEMAECARKNDESAKEVFKICGEYLGRGLAVLVDIFNPEKIIIGSIYERCRDLLEEHMLKTLTQEALPHSLEKCTITIPRLGESIGDMAAIAVAMEVYKQNSKTN